MSMRQSLALAFFVVFLVFQLTVPTFALFAARPARFGWQMYSALPNVPRAWTVKADGTEEPVDMTHLFAMQRAEIDYAAVMLAGLCDASDAVAIKVQGADSSTPEMVACH
jgi:hypothetical protein